MSALQISPEQLHTLGQAMLQRFERGCLADLRRDHPELTQPHADEVLLQFVRHGITRAAALEVTGVSDVKDWLALARLLAHGGKDSSFQSGALGHIREKVSDQSDRDDE